MTTVVVLADAPGDTAPLDALVPDPLTAGEASALSRAMLADVCATLQHGEADLLVNYPPADSESPRDPDDSESAGDDTVGGGDEHQTGNTGSAEASLRELLSDAVPEPGAVRYEPQVGTGRDARVGNALTHLLTEEGEESVAVVEPTAPFLRREHVGRAAMTLRTSDVVLGPAPDGRVTFAGFREPIDFADSYATPRLVTLTERAVAADLEVDFLPTTPLLERPDDLATAVSVLAARREADRLVPPRTTALVEDLGLVVTADGSVSRESDRD
jgi:hypothetical protein